jgi:hypothetical protein
VVNPPLGGIAIGDVPLQLVDASKSLEMTPNGIPMGVVKFRGWQLHRISPLPPEFTGHAAYLIRSNYEFDIEPGVPAPSTASVRFEFPAGDFAVVDVVPRRVTESTGEVAYELDQQLNFVRRNGNSSWSPGAATATVELPPMLPVIAGYGPGATTVGWDHTGTVPAGTHTGYFVLRAAHDATAAKVVARATYDVRMPREDRLKPSARPDAFVIPLPAEPTGPAFVDTAATARPGGPRVFVSYAWDSPAHLDAVDRLVALLCAHGVAVRFDRDGDEVRRNWELWTSTEMSRADFVLVVASPVYLAASRGELPPDRHRGVRSEFERLADLHHRYRDEWTRKLLPVVLPGRSSDEIPLSFLPGIGNYYEVPAFTEDGAAALLRALGVPR